MESKENRKRLRALNVAKLLNLFMGDLAAARQGFVLTEKAIELTGDKIDEDYWRCMHRMHLSHIAITLFKICEVYKQFKDVIPDERKESFKSLYKILEARGAPSLRNKFFGHILDSNTKEPIDNTVLNRYIEDLTKNDYKSFMAWIINDKNSIVVQIESIRDSLMAEHGFTQNEVGNKS